MTVEQSQALVTIILAIASAVSAWLVGRILNAREMNAVRTKAAKDVAQAKGDAQVKDIQLEEAKEAAALKNLQLVQQQVDDQKAQLADQKAQLARMQARELARDSTDQALKDQNQALRDLTAHIGDLKVTYVAGVQAFTVQMQSFSDRMQGNADKGTEKIVEVLGAAVTEVNQQTKTLFEQLVSEIQAMGTRLETAISANKTDPDVITTALSKDLQALTEKVDIMRAEQAETVRVAVADALGKALNRPPEPADKPSTPTGTSETKPNEKGQV